METLILLLCSLFMTPSLDAATMTTLEASYSTESTTSYDPATGSAIVTNPDGSVIVINPSEDN